MLKAFAITAIFALLVLGFRVHLFTVISLWTASLIIKECLATKKIRMKRGYTLSYIAFLALITIAFGNLPYSLWILERKMTQVASELAGKPADVHCNSMIDELTDKHNAHFTAGYALFSSGQIVLRPRWCSEIKRYMEAPENATLDGIYTLNLLTHEAMHIRGERIEAITECQAVQRNHHTAQMLGVSEALASKHAKLYYTEIYPKLNYFSDDCAENKPLDERLSNAPWST